MGSNGGPPVRGGPALHAPAADRAFHELVDEASKGARKADADQRSGGRPDPSDLDAEGLPANGPAGKGGQRSAGGAEADDPLAGSAAQADAPPPEMAAAMGAPVPIGEMPVADAPADDAQPGVVAEAVPARTDVPEAAQRPAAAQAGVRGAAQAAFAALAVQGGAAAARSPAAATGDGSADQAADAMPDPVLGPSRSEASAAVASAAQGPSAAAAFAAVAPLRDSPADATPSGPENALVAGAGPATGTEAGALPGATAPASAGPGGATGRPEVLTAVILSNGTAALPPPQVSQLARLALSAMPGGAELHLAPQELGALRLTLALEGDVVRVGVLAERPETLDLIRRHSADLAAEFRALGYGGAAFSFEQGSRQRFGQGSPAEGAPAAMSGATPTGRPPARTQASGLDIRL